MMQSNNKIIVAAAGAGKTTEIVKLALADSTARILITTYTNNNEKEIRKKFAEEIGYIPENVVIQTWFTFLLRDLVRPYQNAVYETRRVDGLAFVEGQSKLKVAEKNTAAYYFSARKNIYSDKISKFAHRCNEKSDGAVIDRLSKIYEYIYIDEVQDLAGWDIDILELLFKSKISTILVGDYRQATFQTNQSQKNKQFVGANIIKKFDAWEKAKFCLKIEMNHSHRCNQLVCNFSDRFFPSAPKTISKNLVDTGHDGVFIIRKAAVADYIKKYNPQALRYNRKETCGGLPALNFGESKGLSFDRTIVFPHGPFRTVLETGDFSKLKEPSNLYVAVTRARHSVTFVYDGNVGLVGIISL